MYASASTVFVLMAAELGGDLHKRAEAAPGGVLTEAEAILPLSGVLAKSRIMPLIAVRRPTSSPEGVATEKASPFSRVYSAVPPMGMPAEPVRDLMLAAIDVARRLAGEEGGASSASFSQELQLS